MSARTAIWWLLPLSPVGIVMMLVGDGLWDWLGLAMAAFPLVCGLFLMKRPARSPQLSPDKSSPSLRPSASSVPSDKP